jgi:ArsR family transcriptional regulator
VTGHLQYLSKAGIVTSKRIKNWVFYKLDRQQMDEATAILAGFAKQVTQLNESS